MLREPNSLREATITITALITELTANVIAEIIIFHLGCRLSIGEFAFVIILLWTLDELGRLVEDVNE